MSKLHGRKEAELAAVATDTAQHKGLGTELYRRLVQVARDEKLTKVDFQHASGESRDAGHVRTRLGFQMFSSLEDNMIRAELEL